MGMDLQSPSPSSSSSSSSSTPSCATDAARQHGGQTCLACHRAASRLHELEAANDGLKREVEIGARRLRAIMGQLALAEERGGRCALAGAIRSAAAAQPNPCFDAAWARLGDRQSQPALALAPAQRLGAREREVLRRIAEGQRTPAIAERLGITASTVEVHRRNIMRKLGLHTVAGLTKYALREGLTSL